MKKFAVYNSSAGSGKTYTLVKEYLKIALKTKDSNQYRNILAITFTNKAAAEMKERVINALQALSGIEKLEGTPKFLQLDLLKPIQAGGLGIDENEIAFRSKNVLRSILHNYNDFGISTIDKFTHKIIRTFAHDLHLPLNFEIEIDETEVLSKCIDMIISEVGVNKKITKLLVEYTNKKANDEESWQIEKDLFKFSKNLLKDDGELYLEKVRKLNIDDFDNIKKQINIQLKQFEEELKQLAGTALALIEKEGIEEKSFSRGFYPNYWKKILKYAEVMDSKSCPPTETVVKTIAGEKNWYAAKVDSNQKQLIDANQTKFIALYDTSRTYIDRFESNYRVNKLLIKNLYNLAVLNEVEKAILEFKKDNNVLNISDFNKKIAEIVSSEPIPFIYERLGEKYDHYLIDEFQDTSIVQWHNLVPLVDNSLAKGKFNMVVGDAKQAIYRFRGGEVEQIINLPLIYKHDNNPLLIEREDALKRNHVAENLTNNFRSKAEVVDFNNQFFQSVAVTLSEKYQVLYKDLEQAFNPENNGGGVSVEFLPAENKEELEGITFNRINEVIAQNKKDGYSLSDICVLTRSNKDGAAIASYLVENGINVISSESLLIDNSEKVRLILNVLSYLSHPLDKNFQVKILSYLIDNQFKDDDLYTAFAHEKTNPLEAFLENKNLELDSTNITNFSLYELIEYLIKHFNLDKDVDVYLQFFLNKIHEYAARKDNSILNFLEWWELKKSKFSIVVPEGVEAVRIMSIHKSKGLEFPVVIFPFANGKVKMGEDYFWTEDIETESLDVAILPISSAIKKTDFSSVHSDELNKSKLDLINVLYVALTRPKDRLFILSDYKEDKKKGGKAISENGSVSDYLYTFCEDKSANKIDDNHYVFGHFNTIEVKKEQEIINEEFKSIVYNNWRDRISIHLQVPEVWDVEDPKTFGAYGTLLHKILSQINYTSDLEKVLKSNLNKGIISEEDFPKIKDELTALLKNEDINYFFTDFDDLKNEESILLPNGDWYQPDRVIVKDNKTIIVDYKTGDKKKTHIQQVEHYKILLSEMGYQNLETYLLYTKEAKLVVV